MVMRYLGGFNAPSYNPLASNVTTGANTVQQGGIYTSSSASQNIPLGQWVNDQYYNRTSLLLQADNFANGSQNNTFIDSSTNNFTITRNGNATQGNFSPFSNPNGYWSNYFDGSGDYLTVTGSSNLAFGTNSFTIEFFIYFTSVASSQNIYDARPVSTNGAYPVIYLDSTTGKIIYYVNTAARITSDVVVLTNQWYHIAVTKYGAALRMFINGIQQGGVILDATTYLNGTTRPVIGASSDLISPVIGYISNLRVLNGTALYTTNFDLPTSPLTAITNTQLLTCQSNRFVDNSANNYVITKAGDTAIRPFTFFNSFTRFNGPTGFPAAGGAAYFDGTGDWLQIAGNSNLAFGTNDFTIEMFVWFNGTGQVNFYDQRPQSTNGLYPTIYVTGSAFIAYRTNSADRIISNAVITNNRWYHVVVSRVSSVTRMFIDGAQQTQTYNDTNSYLNGTNRPVVGSGGDGQSVVLNGYISNLRVLNGTGYTTVTVPTEPLLPIANTQLLLNSTNAGISDGTNINTFETVGNAQVSTAIKKYGSGSMFFDGTGDWLLIPDNFELRLGAGDFTVECWVYVSSFAGARSMIGKGTSSTGWFFYVATTGRLAFGYDSSTLNGNSALVLNTWNHVALVRYGTLASNVRMYINGNLDAISTSAINLNFNQTNNMYVGCDRTTTNPFLGYIDDLRVTKNFARYISNFVPPTVALPRLG